MRRCCFPRVAVCAAALAVLFAGAGPARAEIIALFDNNTFVDTTSGGISAESDNVQAAFSGLGFTVQTFTGVTDVALTTALAGTRFLVIPELENGNVVGAGGFNAAAQAVIRNYVAGGGGLILFGSSFNQPVGQPRDALFLNTVFGFNVTQVPFVVFPPPVGTSLLNAGAAAGTEFAGGPASLPGHDGTLALVTSSLPAGSRSIYADGPNTSVALIPFGAGEILYVGWDWFDPAQDVAAGGPWLNVLDRGSQEVSPTGVIPEPASIVLMGISAVGLAGAAWRRHRAQVA